MEGPICIFRRNACSDQNGRSCLVLVSVDAVEAWSRLLKMKETNAELLVAIQHKHVAYYTAMQGVQQGQFRLESLLDRLDSIHFAASVTNTKFVDELKQRSETLNNITGQIKFQTEFLKILSSGEYGSQQRSP